MIGLVSILPEGVLVSLSGVLSFFLQKIIAYRKAIIRKNLRKAFPEKDQIEQSHIARQYYQHLSDILVETTKAFHLPKETLQRRFQYQNIDVLRSSLEQGQSIILMGSHYGNWEMGCLSFPLQVDFPVYTVFKPLSNLYVDRYLKKLRGKWGMRMVAMNKLGRVLIENKNTPAVYIFVADQSPASTKQAIWKPFLQQDTPFIPGVEKVVQRTNYPVFYFAIQKLQRGRYTVRFSKLNIDNSMEVNQLTDLYITHLTQQIEQAPEQWLWSHNRWKRSRL